MSGWRKRTIMEMAQEAEFEIDCVSLEWHKRIEAFAALVRADERNRTWTQEHWTEYERSIAAAEREACAKVCESEWSTTQEHVHGLMLADEIRARGQA